VQNDLVLPESLTSLTLHDENVICPHNPVKAFEVQIHHLKDWNGICPSNLVRDLEVQEQLVNEMKLFFCPSKTVRL
jgi:hypothetical protein